MRSAQSKILNAKRPRRIRVCVIGLRHAPDGVGGVEVHCEHLYPEAARLDDSLQFVLLTRSPYSAKRRSLSDNVDVRPIWSPRHKYLETLIHTPLALAYARLFLHPKIVHLHALGPAFFTPLAKLLGFKTIITHHAPDYERPKWGILGRTFLRAGEALAVICADGIICVSESLRRELTKRHPKAAHRTQTIRNGISVCEPQGAPSLLASLGLSPRNYILAVGRLDEVKGFHDLITAFKACRSNGRRLVLVGGAFVTSAYARSIASHASETIVLPGFLPRKELDVLYRNASLLVHPSYMEGYSLVVAEAVAAGTPVLASDIAVHREFELGTNCYFPTGDVGELARLLEAPSTGRYSMATARRICAQDNWKASANALRSCLMALVKAPQRRSLFGEGVDFAQWFVPAWRGVARPGQSHSSHSAANPSDASPSSFVPPPC